MSNDSIIINIQDGKTEYTVVKNTQSSVHFKISNDNRHYTYNIYSKEIKSHEETTVEYVRGMDLHAECYYRVTSNREMSDLFDIRPEHRGYILLIKFCENHETIAEHVLIVQPLQLRIKKIVFLDDCGKEVFGNGETRNEIIYPTLLQFAVRCEYNRALLSGENPSVKCQYYLSRPDNMNGFMEAQIAVALNKKKDSANKELVSNEGFPEHIAGATVALSFGMNEPYHPPFLNDNHEIADSVKIIRLISRDENAPKIHEVLWSTTETIEFGEPAPKRETICRNEDGFLHIHTRGMYGQKVRVEIYEMDDWKPYKEERLISSDEILIADNTAYVPVNMNTVYRRADKLRWFEGKDYEILARIVPLDTSIAAMDSPIMYLKTAEDALAENPARAKVDGIGKVMIGEAREAQQEENKKQCFCGKKHIDLREKMTFAAQTGTSDCNTTCKRIIGALDIEAEGATEIKRTSYYQLATENSSHTALLFNHVKLKEGLEYLDLSLDKGYPVLVGVNHTLGAKKGNEADSDTTDHYVIIVGRYCENDTIYYRFWDVGTRKGADADYKFILDAEKHLVCNNTYRTDKHSYTVTQIRRNKKNGNYIDLTK